MEADCTAMCDRAPAPTSLPPPRLKNGSRKLTMNEGMRFTREGPPAKLRFPAVFFKLDLHIPALHVSPARDWTERRSRSERSVATASRL